MSGLNPRVSLPLSSVLQALEVLAPLELAESWDNVGLLLDPRSDDRETQIERVLLTIDLTRPVLREAIDAKTDCVVAYHPPIFGPLKRLSRRNEGVLFESVAANLAIYSPHTALDAAPGGMNDWLAEAFSGDVSPITPAGRLEPSADLKLVVFVPVEHADALRDALAEAGAGRIGNYSSCSFNLEGVGTFFGQEGSEPVVGEPGRLERSPEVRLEMVCGKGDLSGVARAIDRCHPYEEPAWDVYPLAPKPQLGAGTGRLVTLPSPRTLGELVASVKAHLGLTVVRLAMAPEHAEESSIRRIAVCAGSGASVFERVQDADLYVTGELGHHAVLRAVARGASVVLCEHSNSERGYLPRLRQRLLSATENRIQVSLATADREPLTVV